MTCNMGRRVHQLRQQQEWSIGFCEKRILLGIDKANISFSPFLLVYILSCRKLRMNEPLFGCRHLTAKRQSFCFAAASTVLQNERRGLWIYCNDDYLKRYYFFRKRFYLENIKAYASVLSYFWRYSNVQLSVSTIGKRNVLIML